MMKPVQLVPGDWVFTSGYTLSYPGSRDALALLASETSLVAIAAANVAHGVALTQIDLNRLLTAASRIASIGELFA